MNASQSNCPFLLLTSLDETQETYDKVGVVFNETHTHAETSAEWLYQLCKYVCVCLFSYGTQGPKVCWLSHASCVCVF